MLEEQHENFCSGGDKMGNASGHQCKVKMSDSEKKKKKKKKSEREHVRQFLHKTCNYKGLFTWREEDPSTRKILEGGSS